MLGLVVVSRPISNLGDLSVIMPIGLTDYSALFPGSVS